MKRLLFLYLLLLISSCQREQNEVEQLGTNTEEELILKLELSARKEPCSILLVQEKGSKPDIDIMMDVEADSSDFEIETWSYHRLNLLLERVKTCSGSEEPLEPFFSEAEDSIQVEISAFYKDSIVKLNYVIFGAEAYGILEEEQSLDEVLWAKKLEGYWVHDAFFDGVFANKSIRHQYSASLFTDIAGIIKVENGYFTALGSREGIRKTKLLNFKDSLIAGDAQRLAINFSYLSSLDRIKVYRLRGEYRYQLEYYRRMTKDEISLVASTFQKDLEKSGVFRLSEIVSKYWIDSLLVGTYQAINFPNKNMRIQPANGIGIGRITGFKNYSRYKAHNYCFTHHPFPGDAISFKEDSYDWKFEGDTLILHPLGFSERERYYIDEEKKPIKFIKLAK